MYQQHGNSVRVRENLRSAGLGLELWLRRHQKYCRMVKWLCLDSRRGQTIRSLYELFFFWHDQAFRIRESLTSAGLGLRVRGRLPSAERAWQQYYEVNTKEKPNKAAQRISLAFY